MRVTHLTILFIIFFGELTAQQVSISGFVEDATSSERLVGASVHHINTSNGVLTNNYGYFSIKLKKSEEAILVVSYTGYERQQIKINVQADSSILVALRPILLDQVEVEALKEQHGQQLGKLSPQVSKLQEIPALMGERDIVKSMTLLPGITGGQEGTAALYVRGGSPDQNLFLLDDAVIFNPFHLFGLVSTFNGDAIKNVDIYKGNFPARFGGRLSSVIDLSMREGNRKAHDGKIDVGIISSKAQIEGPINKSRGSYFVSARSTYLNLFTLPINIAYRLGEGNSKFSYWFYDLNAKVNYQLSDTDHIYLSIYNSRDKWQAGERRNNTTNNFSLDWGNATASLRHHKRLKKGIFWKNAFTYSSYQYQSSISNTINKGENFSDNENTEEFLSAVNSSVANSRLKSEIFVPIFRQLKLNSGLELGFYQFNPFFSQVQGGTTNESVLHEQNMNGQELATYIEGQFYWGKKWSMDAGLRYVSFFVDGANYESPEYRFSINRNGDRGWNWSFAYANTSQFLHLLNANSVGLPNDVWLPSTRSIPPSRANQWSIGFSKSSNSRAINFSSEAYIRNMFGLIDYSRASLLQLTSNLDWENELATNGRGFIYGIENMISLDYKQWDMWVSYTWSRSERKFSEINNGKWYFSNFDKTHDLSVLVNFKLSSNWKFNAVWNYQTGRPFTAPVAIIEGSWGDDVIIYGDRNSSRFPAFHRLDLGATYSLDKKGRGRYWSFGIINAYNHINPNIFMVDIPHTNKDYNTTGYRGIGFVPIMPYLSFGMDLFKKK